MNVPFKFCGADHPVSLSFCRWIVSNNPLPFSNDEMNEIFEVNTSGLHCPLPLLRLKKALAEVSSGHVVKLIATDPAAHLDIGVYIEQTGHLMLEIVREDDLQIFFVKKA